MTQLAAALRSPVGRLDMLGILLSGLCLVHCLALPVLLTLLPFGMQYGGDETIHHVLSYLAVPVGVMALIPGYLRHRSLRVPVLGMLGLTLLFALPVLFGEAIEPIESVVTGAGGAVLVYAHLTNRKLGRCALTCCPPRAANQAPPAS